VEAIAKQRGVTKPKSKNSFFQLPALFVLKRFERPKKSPPSLLCRQRASTAINGSAVRAEGACFAASSDHAWSYARRCPVPVFDELLDRLALFQFFVQDSSPQRRQFRIACEPQRHDLSDSQLASSRLQVRGSTLS